jgi:MFS family permease
MIMQDRRQAWIVVALLSVFMMINTADRAVLGLAGPYIIKDLGLTNTQFGQIGSSFFLLYSLSAVVVGFLADRISSRTILVILVVIWSLAQAPLALPVTFEMMIITRIALGAGEGPGYSVALNAVYKWFPDERRTVPSAIVAQGASVGVVLLVPLLNWIIVQQSWHYAFASLALMGAVWVVAWIAFGAEGKLDDHAETEVSTAQRRPYRELLSDRTILGLWIGGFGAFWSYSLLITWIPSYFSASLGIPKEELGAVTALPWLANTAVVLVVATVSQIMLRRGISSRYSRVYLALLCVLAGGVLVAIASWFHTLPSTERLALLVVGVALPTAILALLPPVIAERVPASQRAGMIGIGQALVTLAGVVAPVVTGSIVDSGAASAAGFETGFLLCGAVLIVMPVLGMMMLEPTAARA